MKIILIHDLPPLVQNYGISVNVRNLAKVLNGWGHQTTIGYQAQYGDLGGLADEDFLPLGDGYYLNKQLQPFDAVVVMASMSARPLFLSVTEMREEENKPVIIYFRATSHHRSFSSRIRNLTPDELRAIDQQVNKIILHPCATLVVNSLAMQDNLRQNFAHVGKRKIELIYPGPLWPENLPVKKERNDDCFIFLFCGDIDIDKGAIFLWEAFYQLVLSLPYEKKRKVKLQFVGEGAMKEPIKALSLAFDLEKQVEFLGSLPNGSIFSEMAKADCLVHPSLTESFGMVLVEAMGIGLPVIACDFEGMREVLGKGVLGPLVPRANSQALMKAMRLMLEERTYKSWQEKIAQEDIKSKYSVQRQARRLLEVIKRTKN